MSLPENHLEIAGGVGVFTLNRPRALNAISQAMFERDLPDMVERAEADADLRVLILTGRAVFLFRRRCQTHGRREIGHPR